MVLHKFLKRKTFKECGGFLPSSDERMVEMLMQDAAAVSSVIIFIAILLGVAWDRVESTSIFSLIKTCICLVHFVQITDNNLHNSLKQCQQQLN